MKKMKKKKKSIVIYIYIYLNQRKNKQANQQHLLIDSLTDTQQNIALVWCCSDFLKEYFSTCSARRKHLQNRLLHQI